MIISVGVCPVQCERDIPLRTSVISAIIILTILGLTFLLFSHLYKYYSAHKILSILVVIVLIFIITDITRNQSYRKEKNNKIIAQLVKKKLNSELITGIFMISGAFIGFFLIGNNIKDFYVYLLQGNYINNVFDIVNPEIMGNLKDYAYSNKDIMLFHTILTVEERILSLFSFLFALIFGISRLYYGLHADAISQKGLLTKGRIHKWKDFTSYNWGKYYDLSTTKNPTGYYDLELAYKNGKILAYILREKESNLTLKISAEDRVKVDNFLHSVITKGDGHDG